MAMPKFEIRFIVPPSSASDEVKASMLTLYEGERDTWPNPSKSKIENSLKHALALGIIERTMPASVESFDRSDILQSSESEASQEFKDQHVSKDVLGFILMTGESNDPLLEDMIISPEIRGQGIGIKLIQEILKQEPFNSAPSVDTYCKGHLGTLRRL